MRPQPNDQQQPMNKHPMKILTMALAAALFTTIPLHAGEDHSHGPKVAGPNGGRLITSIDPRAEFLLTPDRKVQVTFVGQDGKPVSPGEQIVAVTTGERSAPLKLNFTKTGAALVSDQSVPEGGPFPVVIQIKSTPDSKAVVERFTLNLSPCPECKMAEYACICSHSH
jgi:hypothetical protein